MAEMKTLNGREVVDASAREQISTLKTNLITTVADSTSTDITINALAESYEGVNTLLFTYATAIATITQLTTTLKQGISIQFTAASAITNSVTDVYFMGDDCAEGVFTPVADAEYEIALWPTSSGVKAGVISYG